MKMTFEQIWNALDGDYVDRRDLVEHIENLVESNSIGVTENLRLGISTHEQATSARKILGDFTKTAEILKGNSVEDWKTNWPTLIEEHKDNLMEAIENLRASPLKKATITMNHEGQAKIWHFDEKTGPYDQPDLMESVEKDATRLLADFFSSADGKTYYCTQTTSGSVYKDIDESPDQIYDSILTTEKRWENIRSGIKNGLELEQASGSERPAAALPFSSRAGAIADAKKILDGKVPLVMDVRLGQKYSGTLIVKTKEEAIFQIGSTQGVILSGLDEYPEKSKLELGKEYSFTKSHDRVITITDKAQERADREAGKSHDKGGLGR